VSHIDLNRIATSYRPIHLNVPDHASFQNEHEPHAFNGLVQQTLKCANFKDWKNRMTHLQISERDLSNPPPTPRYLEIGTYRGCSLVQVFAMCPGMELHTLNILPEQARDKTIELLPKEEIGLAARQQGIAFTQHYGDSKEFDFSELGEFDVIFIDGCHEPSYVKYDAVTGRNLLSPGGVLIFHDYHDRNEIGRGVMKMLDYLNSGALFDGQLQHIEGTSLVYWRKPL
jgi:hypothetical protein